MQAVDLAWQAGIFEGEGSVRIDKPAPNRRNLGVLVVQVVNCQPEITEVFHAAWGGARKYGKAQPPRREWWRWVCAARQAAAFLEAIQPYLRTACYQERAVLGREFQAQKLTSRWARARDPEYNARQFAYYERMAVLNRRGC